MGVTIQQAEQIFESSLAKLDDALYLNLVRNYLGSVPTPFHKPQLTKRLVTLFSNHTFLSRLVTFITPFDAQVLSALFLAQEATQEELAELFASDRPYLELQQQLVNLEERLLLIPALDREALIINPLLLPLLLEKGIIALQHFFSSETAEAEELQFHLLFDHTLMRSLFSLHLHNSIPSGSKGQRWFQSAKVRSIFSGWNEEALYSNILLLEEVFIDSSIICVNKGETFLDLNRANELLAFSRRQLQLFNVAQLARVKKLFLKASNSQLQEYFSAVWALLSYGKAINTMSLRVVLGLMAIRYHLKNVQIEALQTLLIETGAVSEPIGTAGVMYLNPALLRKNEEQEERVFTIDSDFSVTFSGQPCGNQKQDFIHLLCQVEKVNTLSAYRLTKESFQRSCDLGCTLEESISFLEELSGRPLAPPLRSSLTQWNAESAALKLYDGITVVADERISRLIEGHPDLQQYLVTTIAPHCYLFSRQHQSTWRAILSAAGSVFLPRNISEEETECRQEQEIEPLLTSTFSWERQKEQFRPLVDHALFTVQDPNPVIESLAKKIGVLKIDKYEQEELQQRLQSGLLLLDEQIVPLGGRDGPMTATGFDLQGKINLMRTAISAKHELLELHMIDEDGEMEKMVVQPAELIGGNRDYTLRFLTLPEYSEHLVPVDKIFFVRRLRRSVFFQ